MAAWKTIFNYKTILCVHENMDHMPECFEMIYTRVVSGHIINRITVCALYSGFRGENSILYRGGALKNVLWGILPKYVSVFVFISTRGLMSNQNCAKNTKLC